jgi:hypothetical protein
MRDMKVNAIAIISAPPERFAELGKDLDELEYKYKKVQGSYKGKREDSYLVVVNEKDGLSGLVFQALAKKYKQESILFRDSWGSAYLAEHETGKITPLGKFVQCSEEEAKGKDHTFDPESKQYYICRKG